MRIALLLYSVLLFTHSTSAQEKSLIHFVNPLVGTGKSNTPSALLHSEGTELKGQTFPATGRPWGMTNWTPETRLTEQKCVAPYYYEDQFLYGFRGSHWTSGSCMQDYGSISITPIMGDPVTDPEKRKIPFRHEDEYSDPAYYRIELKDFVKVEITGTERTGLLKFTCKKSGKLTLMIQPNSDEGKGAIEYHPPHNEISITNPVHRIYQGKGLPAGFSGHAQITFNKKPIAKGVYADDTILPGQLKVSDHQSIGAFVSFQVKAGDVIILKAGTSFTSVEQAKQNSHKEIPHWDFEKVKNETEKAWNDELNKIRITASDSLKQLFYTALYHTMLTPRIYSDADGTYPLFASDYKTGNSSFTRYGDFSLWDTFRAVHPLYSLVFPSRATDMAQTLIAMADESGWMPNFPCWNNFTSAMVGDHAAIVIAEAFSKQLITTAEAEKAFNYLNKNATQSPSEKEYKDGRGRRALPSYLKYGYIPLEDSVWDAFHKREQVSRTLEYGYDDYALSTIAKNLNDTERQTYYATRAKNYRNVIDPSSGFARGKYADGTWIQPFNPTIKPSFITEGTPWQYTYSVPHDVKGLIEVLGGETVFEKSLDSLFGNEQYWHGNEPGHHIPYLYNYCHAPHKTQKIIHKIRQEEYSNGPGGLSGNDDSGQMSAWLVFSSIGFYPVFPADPVYSIGTPLFEQVELNLENGNKFTILASNLSDENYYVKTKTLNGSILSGNKIKYSELVKGGRFIFYMDNKPTR